MAEDDGAEHHLFAQLLGLGLDHQHAFLGAGNDEIESGFLDLRPGRVQDVLSVNVAAHGRHRSVP